MTILLAVFLPLAALMVVLAPPVCQALAQRAIAQNVADPLEQEHLVAVAMAVRDFSVGNDDAAMPAGVDYRYAITADAIEHLLDVRVVFVGAEIACLLLLVILLVLVGLTWRRSKSAALKRPLTIGGLIPLLAALGLGIAVFVDFDAFFTWLHSLFFADGSWTFPADSLLIRALPYNFWLSCAVVWALCMAVFCCICIAVGLVLPKRRGVAAAHSGAAAAATK